MSNRFSDLGINSEIQQSLSALQISTPTEIQKKVIPVILSQKEDVVALAKTGTGKTAAFGLPLLQLINIFLLQITFFNVYTSKQLVFIGERTKLL